VKECTRADFHRSVAASLASGTGLAAGKLGFSEHALMHLPAIMDVTSDPHQRAALLTTLRVHACRQSGVFPDDEGSIREFGDRLLQVYQRMDYLAVLPGLPLPPVLTTAVTPRSVAIEALEPNRSHSYDPDDCYLPHLRGARVLIISSIADVLAARAQRDVFEAVWSRIGAPWPQPRSVEALSFPFIYDADVQARHTSVWEVFDDVCREMSRADFDIALIAAGALGSPLALAAKDLGAVGISLGGHLQVLFGVHGKRWLDDREWSTRYINDAWIAPPEDRKPQTLRGLTDDGAYW